MKGREIWLRQQAEKLGVVLSNPALEQLVEYGRLLQERLQRVNLTAIRNLPDIYERHFLDSLTVALAVDFKQIKSLIDVGTGAGFPGLVLAIAFPHTRVVLLESISKKVRFLQTVVQTLGLEERVEVVCERAEVVGQNPAFREQFDLAVARAVARLVTLAEYCLPLVRVGGCFVAQKGPFVSNELREAGSCLMRLGGDNVRGERLILPSGGVRILLAIDKCKSTPSKYPRRPGLPRKRPLYFGYSEEGEEYP